ncbi:uncharacterized protein SPSK_00576 [Sporothrix schenckii 1099-18]|uniref:Uncharacterized protein n=2 Tax=Sporothrix schenckii TaxID=29908 RepID=U7Q5Z4_SPOS1|nr:uncharacterized protein SPSK_00576 [Sporothrix schenckii 1099-18]ERT02602.1 hypothetical protein HMPREF1624_00903 [Sporothrix schenckii ATCC 58251]KJR80102.1 hypothetical protein SPSK_00576 [Sporothrix schenckii 1099-18]
MVSSNEKTGSSGSNNGPPPLPVRPTSPPVTTPVLGGFGFASASSSSLNVHTPGSASGTPNAGPSSTGSLRLSAQHERLILELLPFKDASQFREWLAFLEGDWEEYCRDYLDPQYFTALYDESGNAVEIPDKAPSDPEPDKAATAQRAKDAINNQSVIFLAYHPDKTTWTPEDHAVRFLATAIADSLLRKVWGERDWRKRPLEIAKAVYEVLSYKRAGYVGYQQQLWAMRQQQRQQSQHQQQQQPQGQAQQHTSQHQEAATLERLRRQHQPMPARRPHPDEMMDNPPDYNA